MLKKKKQQKKVINLRNLDNIKTLWYEVYVAEKPLADMAAEFFHAIGEILEGTPIHQISLEDIPRDELKEYQA